MLLMMIARAVLRGKAVAPTVEKLARKLDRSPTTVKRWTRVLRTRGWVRVYRRAHRDANLYTLTPRLWARLTGHRTAKYPSELVAVLQRLGLRAGVSPSRMRRAGVRQ